MSWSSFKYIGDSCGNVTSAWLAVGSDTVYMKLVLLWNFIPTAIPEGCLLFLNTRNRVLYHLVSKAKTFIRGRISKTFGKFEINFFLIFCHEVINLLGCFHHQNTAFKKLLKHKYPAGVIEI